MASIQDAVLQYFQVQWPNATANSNFTNDLGLDPRQVLDIGTALAEKFNCYPTRTQILGCATIGALITLLEKTQE